MKEADIANKLIASIQQIGGMIYKISFEGARDCPDYIVLYNGIHLVETKAPGCKPRESQQYLFEQIALHSQRVVHVISSQKEIDSFIALILSI